MFINSSFYPKPVDTFIDSNYIVDESQWTLFENEIAKIELLAAPFDRKQYSPLHVAIVLGNKTSCRQLLEAGADPNTFSLNGLSPVFFALKFGHEEIAMLLVEKGTDLLCLCDFPGCPRRLPIFWWIFNLDADRILEYVLAHKRIDPDLTLYGIPLIEHVWLAGKHWAIDPLIAASRHQPVEPNDEQWNSFFRFMDSHSLKGSRDQGDYTRLHFAAAAGDLVGCIKLLKAGANPNDLAKADYSALTLAILSRNQSIAMSLLQFKADHRFMMPQKVGNIDVQVEIWMEAFATDQVNLCEHLLRNKLIDPNESIIGLRLIGYTTVNHKKTLSELLLYYGAKLFSTISDFKTFNLGQPKPQEDTYTVDTTIWETLTKAKNEELCISLHKFAIQNRLDTELDDKQCIKLLSLALLLNLPKWSRYLVSICGIDELSDHIESLFDYARYEEAKEQLLITFYKALEKRKKGICTPFGRKLLKSAIYCNRVALAEFFLSEKVEARKCTEIAAHLNWKNLSPSHKHAYEKIKQADPQYEYRRLMKLMGHRFSLKGKLFEGVKPYYIHYFCKQIYKTSYLRDSIREDFSFIPNITVETAMERYSAHQNVVVPTGWLGHATSVVFKNKVCAKINLGDKSGSFSGISFYIMESGTPEKIKKAISSLLTYKKEASKENVEVAVHYFNDEIDKELGLKKFAWVRREQDSGNCGWVAIKHAFETILMNNEMDTNTIAALTFEEANHVFLKIKGEFNNWESVDRYNSFYDLGYLNRRFPTVVNEEKLNEYLSMLLEKCVRWQDDFLISSLLEKWPHVTKFSIDEKSLLTHLTDLNMTLSLESYHKIRGEIDS